MGKISIHHNNLDDTEIEERLEKAINIMKEKGQRTLVAEALKVKKNEVDHKMLELYDEMIKDIVTVIKGG